MVSLTQCDLKTAPAITWDSLVVDLLGELWSTRGAYGVVSRSWRPRVSAPDSAKTNAFGREGRGLICGQESLRGEIGRSDLRTAPSEAWDRGMATPLAFWLVGTENLGCRTPAESLSFQATVM